MLAEITTPSTLAFGLPGGTEWIVLLVIGLLIFGRRLPEVGRSLGRGIVEFKRGVKGIEDEIETESGRSGELPASGQDTPQLDAQTQPQQQQRPAKAEAPVKAVGVAGEGPNPYAASDEPGR